MEDGLGRTSSAARLGAVILLNTPAKTFLNLVPWLLLFAALVFAVSDPVMKLIQRRTGHAVAAPMNADGEPVRNYWPLVLATTVICFYIGYFGAGAGFLIISLTLCLWLHRISTR